MYDYSKLPIRLQEPMKLYAEDRIRPGGFLTALLSNDLLSTFRQADKNNEPEIINIIFWVFWELPVGSWGSREKVEEWLGN